MVGEVHVVNGQLAARQPFWKTPGQTLSRSEVRLPNSKKEELLFSDLPEEELYAVASATYYHTQAA